MSLRGTTPLEQPNSCEPTDVALQRLYRVYGFRIDRRGRRRESGSWHVPEESSHAPVTGRLDTAMVGVKV